MKKILKTSLFAFLAIALASCENEKDTVAVAQGGTKLLTPSSGTTYVLNPLNASSTTVTTLVWEQSENGVPTAANYTIQLAKAGTNFATPLNAGTTNNRFASWTTEQLNGVLSSDPTILPYVPQTMNLRIKSSIGSAANAVIQYSNVISITVTPYSLALPKLGVPGNHQGWDPTSATLPVLAASAYGNTNFEGYINLNGGFKFLTQRPNGTFNWGAGFEWADDGTFSGTLVGTGGSNCTAAAGYYLVKANTGVTTPTNPGGLAYSTTLITRWDITGDATPLSWPDPATNGNNSTPMTYNATTKKWSITIALTGGKAIKFRANNSWNINLGKFDASKTGNDFGGDDMSYGGLNIPIATSGTYTVTLDVSSPRAYKYTIN
jgi:starch-binding outer membrane protein SusE/F